MTKASHYIVVIIISSIIPIVTGFQWGLFPAFVAAMGCCVGSGLALSISNNGIKEKQVN